jgi:hypothetical protein
MLSTKSTRKYQQLPTGLAQNMSFVLNIPDKHFITTVATQKKVKTSSKKQQLSTTHLSSAISYINLDLDYSDTIIGSTLRQAVMQMRSNSSPGCNLFLAIDTSSNGSIVSFLFKKEVVVEVQGLLPALPLVCSINWGLPFGTG